MAYFLATYGLWKVVTNTEGSVCVLKTGHKYGLNKLFLNKPGSKLSLGNETRADKLFKRPKDQGWGPLM